MFYANIDCDNNFSMGNVKSFPHIPNEEHAVKMLETLAAILHQEMNCLAIDRAPHHLSGKQINQILIVKSRQILKISTAFGAFSHLDRIEKLNKSIQFYQRFENQGLFSLPIEILLQIGKILDPMDLKCLGMTSNALLRVSEKVFNLDREKRVLFLKNYFWLGLKKIDIEIVEKKKKETAAKQYRILAAGGFFSVAALGITLFFWHRLDRK